MGRRFVRPVEPVVHISVKQRWEHVGLRYRSPGLAALIERVGWNGVTVVE